MSVRFNISGVDEWNAKVRTLVTAKNSMAEAGEKMKGIVLESLTKSGIKGDTADLIVKAYEEDVLVTINKFISEVDSFISKNKSASAGADEMLAKMKSTVARM